ncbi:hypothetical protein D3875_17380 [Deinococcus cavernae]|uniref:Uncharacterized protein n=1 Tax=Deinococcus cavernae TaxID=2320857 RepID=A0A418VAJ3_9DEIO|nr:hypothetical protein [Deinococcus cavernae]RJF73052.1 hypothetical protein D3875_17380 [Deinococcus cavernae]
MGEQQQSVSDDENGTKRNSVRFTRLLSWVLRKALKQRATAGSEVPLKEIQQAVAQASSTDLSMLPAHKLAYDAHHLGQIMTTLHQHDAKHAELDTMLFMSWADL